MTKTMTLTEMYASLAAVEAEIEKAKRVEKAEKALKACKLNHRTGAKYFDLQQAYLQSLKG